ncbi:MAG: hypothetical protein K0R18_172 [Bacillales bacterium]|jgi:hypothetical protein|nr:hypothetical protein [Bacillales bacterium]
MLDEVQEYLDALYIMRSLTGDHLEKYKFIRKVDRVDFSSLTACYADHTTKKFTMKWIPIISIIIEPDFTISFTGKFNKWDGPFEKNLNLYANKHKGYKSINPVPQSRKTQFLFNFSDIESFKKFFEMYYWREYASKR